jgi:hypothetical protein
VAGLRFGAKHMKSKRYLMFENYYICEVCNNAWADTWNCACDDKCSECNRSYSPVSSETFTIKAKDIPSGLKLEDMIEAK